MDAAWVGIEVIEAFGVGWGEDICVKPWPRLFGLFSCQDAIGLDSERYKCHCHMRAEMVGINIRERIHRRRQGEWKSVRAWRVFCVARGRRFGPWITRYIPYQHLQIHRHMIQMYHPNVIKWGMVKINVHIEEKRGDKGTCGLLIVLINLEPKTMA